MGINKFNSEGYSDPTAYEALSNVAKAEKAYKPLVYICSPYSGDITVNTENACKYSRFAVDKGFIPLTPHLLFPQFLDENNPNHRELGLFFGIVLLGKCSEIWVFGRRVADDNSRFNHSEKPNNITREENVLSGINSLTISSGMAAEITKAKRKNIPIRYFNDQCEEVLCK